MPVVIGGAAALLAVGYILYKRSKASAAAGSTTASTATPQNVDYSGQPCTDGNGNPGITDALGNCITSPGAALATGGGTGATSTTGTAGGTTTTGTTSTTGSTTTGSTASTTPPNVVGQTVSQAIATLQAAGWTVNNVIVQGQAGVRNAQVVPQAQAYSHPVVAVNVNNTGIGGNAIDLYVNP
jgi:PASTA domain